MPVSKHRRKGKTRARKSGTPPPFTGEERQGAVAWPAWSSTPLIVPPLSPIELERERQKDALLMAQLKKMYGGNDWDDWTDEQVDAALGEIGEALNTAD